MLVFVGIGPGDPELITRKAARILREADAIALPDSGSGNSAVMQIVGDLIADKPLCRLEMPMCGMPVCRMRSFDSLIDWCRP